MVLNLYKIINKTDGDYVILSNDENSDDNYSVTPGEAINKDCWLPMSENRRVRIMLNNLLILQLSDQDRSLVVEGRWNAILRKQRVNGSKDFYLTVSKSQAVFTCNGSFADGIESFTVNY